MYLLFRRESLLTRNFLKNPETFPSANICEKESETVKKPKQNTRFCFGVRFETLYEIVKPFVYNFTTNAKRLSIYLPLSQLKI
jgi:hypothetical protein